LPVEPGEVLVGQYPITRRQAVAARLSPVACWTVPRLVRAQHERERTPGTPTLQGRFVCGICDRKMQAHWANNLACYRCRFPNEYALANKISHPRNVYVRETDVLPGLDAWLAEEFAPTASPRPSTTSPPPSACSLMSLARNWGLPIRHHSQFSGIGHLDLPAPPSPAMRAVTMRTGALGRLELVTRIPGHDSIATAARVLYDGRASALVQMLHKIETAARFTIIDRSGRPLGPHGGRPRVHPGSFPDPPDRSGTRGPTGRPAGRRPEPRGAVPARSRCAAGELASRSRTPTL